MDSRQLHRALIDSKYSGMNIPSSSVKNEMKLKEELEKMLLLRGEEQLSGMKARSRRLEDRETAKLSLGLSECLDYRPIWQCWCIDRNAGKAEAVWLLYAFSTRQQQTLWFVKK